MSAILERPALFAAPVRLLNNLLHAVAADADAAAAVLQAARQALLQLVLHAQPVPAAAAKTVLQGLRVEQASVSTNSAGPQQDVVKVPLSQVEGLNCEPTTDAVKMGPNVNAPNAVSTRSASLPGITYYHDATSGFRTSNCPTENRDG